MNVFSISGSQFEWLKLTKILHLINSCVGNWNNYMKSCTQENILN